MANYRAHTTEAFHRDHGESHYRVLEAMGVDEPAAQTEMAMVSSYEKDPKEFAWVPLEKVVYYDADEEPVITVNVPRKWFRVEKVDGKS